MAVLMGANSRTYKFALGAALLELAQAGRDDVALEELAGLYVLRLAERAGTYPQGPASSVTGDKDFLRVLADEASATLASGQPTERLLVAAVGSMPQMVMQKFHNLRGVGEVEHTFYEVRGSGGARRVVLTSALAQVARHEALLSEELSARWSIVETCFDAGVGRNLIDAGVVVSSDGTQLLVPVRRVAVAGAREGLSGFQHGRCFYCHDALTGDGRDTHVDHVYPYALMKTGSWTGPDLNAVWNLVVACANCNLRKSSRLPTVDEVSALVARNDAIAASPHPLRRALEVSMRRPGASAATSVPSRRAFISSVHLIATDRGLT